MHRRQEGRPPWRPEFYFGTVNHNDQFARLDQWRRAAERADGMLLHVHFFVRRLTTPDNRPVKDAGATIRALAPNLARKKNLLELTYHLRSPATSPEAIAAEHAKNVADIEGTGIPVAGVNVDWILGGLTNVQRTETPRRPGESDDSHQTRILNGAVAKSARYVKAFRAAGRDEKLYAVFPPVYLDEGPWTNARKEVRPGLSASRLLHGLFDAGFDGFTADSPLFVLANPAYEAAGYLDALRSLEWTCRRRGRPFGFIVTGDNAATGAAYDKEFARSSMEALDALLAAGLRPDQVISESWYKGPYRLVPETEPGTFTHTVLRLADRLGR